MPPRIPRRVSGSLPPHLSDGVRSPHLPQRQRGSGVSHIHIHGALLKYRQRSQVPPSYPELPVRGHFRSHRCGTDFSPVCLSRIPCPCVRSGRWAGLLPLYSIHLSGGFRNVPSGSQLSPLRHFPVHPLRPHLPGQRPLYPGFRFR